MMNRLVGTSGVSYKIIAYIVVACLLFFSKAHANDWIYTTSKGDTLWDFSQKYLHHALYWEKIKRLNQIKEPRRLQPNKRLRVPLKWIKARPISAKVLAFQGKVNIIRHQQSQLQAVQLDMALNLGDVIETDNQSNVAIAFADGSQVVLDENSSAAFDHLTAYGESGMVDSRLRLNYGQVESKVKKAVGPGSRFEIKTTSAVSAVRGTEYRLSTSQEQDSTLMEVIEGEVRLVGDNKGVIVVQGQGSMVQLGAKPSVPKALLAAPILKEIPNPIRGLNWLVQWEPVTGAKHYRLDISTNKDFQTRLWSKTSAYPRANLPILDDGSYFLRLRAIDADGLDGIEVHQSLLLDVYPQPPVLVNPRSNAIFRAKGPKLEWAQSQGIKQYQLQLADNDKFTGQLLKNQVLERHYMELDELKAPGDYFWRVASINADGELGPFSPVRKFTVKAIPKNLKVKLEQEVISSNLNLSWNQMESGQRFEVQLAEDAEFTSIIKEASLEQAFWQLEEAPAMVRYFRVRAIESDGYIGSWSNVQKIDPPFDSGWLYIFLPALLLIFLL